MAARVGVIFRVAAEGNFECVFGALEGPGIAEAEPFVGRLNLPAVTDFLIEDAVLVADAVADGWDLQRRQRIQVTGGETPESAIAEAWLLLSLQDRIEVQVQARERLADIMEAQIQDVGPKLRTNQELRRQIGHGLAAVARVELFGRLHAHEDSISDSIRQRHIQVYRRSALERGAGDIDQVVEKRAADAIDRTSNPSVQRSFGKLGQEVSLL